MITLNLKTETHEHEKIKTYLQENASDVLAEKINHGVRIQKDGKSLISKKTLNSFMAYAESEARKLATKGTKCACIDDATVYGWAIHYFEEDSIEGKLYNVDGSEYQLKTVSPSAKSVPPPAPKPKPQISLFDIVQPQEETKESEDDSIEELVIDQETGEILQEAHKAPLSEDDDLTHDLEMTKAFDKEALCVLYELFGEQMILR